MSKRVYGISQYTGAKVANHDVRKKVQPWQRVQRERGLSGSGQMAFGKPGSPLDAIRLRGRLSEKVYMAAHRRKYGRN